MKAGMHDATGNGKHLNTSNPRAIARAASPRGGDSPAGAALPSAPVATMRPTLQPPRQEILDDAKLGEYWRGLNASQRATDLALRAARLALLLGGQRLEAVVRAKTLDVDLQAQTVRLFDVKGSGKPRPHLLPLLPMARAEVEWLLAHSQALGSEWLFASRGDGRMQATSVSRAANRMCVAMNAAGTTQVCVRRTLETYFASQAVSHIVRAHIYSHSLWQLQNRKLDWYDYMNEKREALQMLESFLSSFGVPHSPGDPL